jgi:hypothetical protein
MLYPSFFSNIHLRRLIISLSYLTNQPCIESLSTTYPPPPIDPHPGALLQLSLYRSQQFVVSLFRSRQKARTNHNIHLTEQAGFAAIFGQFFEPQASGNLASTTDDWGFSHASDSVKFRV